MKSAHDYTLDLTKRHPELGEMLESTVVSAESLRQLRRLYWEQAQRIELKPLNGANVTPEEKAYIVSSADMLLRNLYVTVEDVPTLLQNATFVDALKAVVKPVRFVDLDGPFADRLKEVDYSSHRNVTNALDAAVSTVQRASTQDPSWSAMEANVVDTGYNALEALAVVADIRGGLPVSQYMLANFTNMLAQFEIVASSAQAA